jgi:hypothetical protein
LIALLRNPVDRAYSHYCHTVRQGRESLSFEEALDKEGERLNGIIKRMHEDSSYTNSGYNYYSYLHRGVYVDQLKRWFRFFSEHQILILSSEELYAYPSNCYARALQFLDLPEWKLEHYPVYNVSPGVVPMDAETRGHLIEYFKPHNARLYSCLGYKFDWDK